MTFILTLSVLTPVTLTFGFHRTITILILIVLVTISLRVAYFVVGLFLMLRLTKLSEEKPLPVASSTPSAAAPSTLSSENASIDFLQTPLLISPHHPLQMV